MELNPHARMHSDRCNGKTMPIPVGVMHVSDTLDTGGAERVAVNLVNLLPRERYCTHLCTTRREGPLADQVANDVRRLRLGRRQRFDTAALRRLAAYIRHNHIQILHAHATSLFIAAAASFFRFRPSPAIVWHDHFGRYALEERQAWLYRLAVSRVNGVIAVNRPLAEWSRRRLHMPANRVWYIPNFVCEATPEGTHPDLPGTVGARIACVANLRPQKDHPTLIRALAEVVRQVPNAHLLMVGEASDQEYCDLIRKEISQHRLERHVSMLGQRRDVSAILQACDIAVLSSASEGLPLALMEYGLARLPAVATHVGQCPEVLDDGRAGILVPPAASDQLAEALVSLLHSPDRRRSLGERLHRRVQLLYSPSGIVQQICRVYDTVLSSSS